MANQSADPAARAGAWESRGSSTCPRRRPRLFLVDVQAHTILTDVTQVGTLTFKREGGQLMLLRVPGA